MRVSVELLGVLQTYAGNGGQPLEVEIEAGATVGDLMAQLGVLDDEVWNASVDGKLIYADDPLVEGATVLVFPPLAGG
jgi:molybdopterin converting factor small subunit